MASASIMTEIIKGKQFNIAKKIQEDFLNMIKEVQKLNMNSLTDTENMTMMSLSGVKEISNEGQMCYSSMAYVCRSS